MPSEDEAVKSPFSVLVVDGSARAFSLLKETLEARSIAVLHVATADEAISLLALMDADLVIVDLEATPMDGLRLVNWLLQLPPARPTPRVIALSADASLEAALSLLNIVIVRKPVAAIAIHEAVRRAFEGPAAGLPIGNA